MKRRTFMGILASLVPTAGLAYWQRNRLTRMVLTSFDNGASPTLAPQAGTDTCVLMPEQTPGPYYIESPIRSDIREDRTGLRMELEIELVNVSSCNPIEGVTVEIWHCDDAGGYSGYGSELSRAAFDILMTIPITRDGPGAIPPSEPSRYLRGGQYTGKDGKVRFTTIFPGWYEPRACHIHMRVSKGDLRFLTTQLYFTDELTAEIYGSHPSYVPHGLCPYNLKNDLVLRDFAEGTGVILAATKSMHGVTASLRAAIDMQRNN